MQAPSKRQNKPHALIHQYLRYQTSTRAHHIGSPWSSFLLQRGRIVSIVSCQLNPLPLTPMHGHPGQPVLPDRSDPRAPSARHALREVPAHSFRIWASWPACGHRGVASGTKLHGSCVPARASAAGSSRSPALVSVSRCSPPELQRPNQMPPRTHPQPPQPAPWQATPAWNPPPSARAATALSGAAAWAST